MLKLRIPDWDIVIERASKSALVAQECDNWCDDSVYTYQINGGSSEQSRNSDNDKKVSLV